jgi:hypothetical protein
VTFECGKYYWIRNIAEKGMGLWRPIYIGQDADNNLWIFGIDVPSRKLSKKDLSRYKIKHLPQPK